VKLAKYCVQSTYRHNWHLLNLVQTLRCNH